MNSTVNFPALLQAFFTRRLMQQRRASAHTIGSYRDTFRLLLQFVQAKIGQQPSQLAFEQLDAPLIAEFLHDLEKTRGSTARSRRSARACSPASATATSPRPWRAASAPCATRSPG